MRCNDRLSKQFTASATGSPGNGVSCVAGPPKYRAGMSIRILIVDDEHLVRENIKAYLEDEGMSVSAVASGEEALQQVRQDGDFAVCIMDMRLPGMDGNASIRCLHACCPDMRFIVHTGSVSYSLPDDLEILGLRQRQVYLKPLLDMEPLAAEVRRLAQGGPDAEP